MKSRTLFVHQAPHFVHDGFAKSIDADYIYYDRFKFKFKPTTIRLGISGIRLPDYDYYLCEGGVPMIPAVSKKIFSGSGKVIEIVADEVYARIVMGLSSPSLMHSIVYRAVSSKIDGAIANSIFAKEIAEKVLTVPIRVAYPFIADDIYQELSINTPDLDSHRIIMVGKYAPGNGIDILVEGFKDVKKEFDDAELYIIGSGVPNQFENINGVHVEGFVGSIVPYYKSASLFVLSARIQTFAVCVVESLRAGVPAIVTKNTGTKEIVKELGEEFIRNVDAEDIAKGIINYFDLSHTKKVNLSEKSRSISKKFNSYEMKNMFRQEYNKLLEDI